MKARLVSLPLVRPPARWLLRLRDKVRASEIMFVAVAIAVGSGAGLLTLLQDAMTRGLQQLLCGFPSHLRLSELTAIPAWRLLALSLGGLALSWFHAAGAGRQAQADRRDGGERAAPRPMGVADSLVISGQTILSNGFGASVGLEAAYAQLGSMVASFGGAGWNCIAPIRASWPAPARARQSPPRSERGWPAPPRRRPSRRPSPLRWRARRSRSALARRRTSSRCSRGHRSTSSAIVPMACADGLDPDAEVATLARPPDCALTSAMDIIAVMRMFDTAQVDELAVVDGGREMLGSLSDKFARKRYAEELDKARRELSPECKKWPLFTADGSEFDRF